MVLLIALAVAPAAGAATGGRAPSVAARQGGADVVEDTVAVTILKSLGLGVTTKAGGEGFGWVLQAFGLGGDGMTAEQLENIRGELTEIKDSLKQVQEATTQLRSDVAKEGYDDVTQQAIAITSRVTTGMIRLEEVAQLPNDDPTKKNLAADTLGYIDKYLMGPEQEDLADRIEGQAGGSGLVKDASKVNRSLGTFWTAATSEKVRQVLDFYQGMEAQLLLLRVEYMHSRPDTYSDRVIANEIKRVQDQLKAQDKLIKASPPPGTLADTRSNRLFDFNEIDEKFKFKETAEKYKADEILCTTCWKISTRDSLSAMLTGWTGPSWLAWLDGQTKGAIAPLATVGGGFKGVWFGIACDEEAAELRRHNLAYTCQTHILTSNEVESILVALSPNYETGPAIRPDEGYGYVLEKPLTEPEEYWYN